MSRVDVLYVAYNRLEFTQATFSALLENTDWSLVSTLMVKDDDSSDGTRAYLHDALHAARSRLRCATVFSAAKMGGPVAAMNWYLSGEWAVAGGPGPSPLFAKVDNDFVMPPGWLNDLLAVMDVTPELDILGCEPFVGLDTEPPLACAACVNDGGLLLGYTPARHIGGKGLIRASAFEGREMWADGYQGFTQWQERNEDVAKGWITPDIRCFGLDQLPLEPWRSLTTGYVDAGWQRRWPEYSEASHDYWDWWL